MEMTNKERWLGALAGEDIDRLLFWPKIYNNTYAAAQEKPFGAMSIRELHDYAGTDIQQFLPSSVRFARKECGYSEGIENGVLHTRYTTPIGGLHGIFRYDAASDSYHPEKPAVGTVEDIRVMTRYFADITPEYDCDNREQAAAMYRDFGSRGLCADTIGESPLMDFIEWYAGIENGHLLLCDYPEEIAELFAEIHRVNCQSLTVACEHSPADALYFIENTSTTIISPSQFEEFCQGHLTDYANIAKRYNRRLVFHMCGHIRNILPMLAEIPFTAIEALSSPPIGNTTLAQARAALPDKSFIGGTNCLTWLNSPEEIIRELEQALAELPHYRGIILGTGGIVPPGCTPQTLKAVFDRLAAMPMK